MKPLRILLCGGDVSALQKKAKMLADEGVQVETSTRLIGNLCFSNHEWDFLLIDLDGLSSFLRSLLPAVSRNFPQLPMIGLSTKATEDISLMQFGYGLTLDVYFFEALRLEDLIVRFPQVASKYLCDPSSLLPAGIQPLTS